MIISSKWYRKIFEALIIVNLHKKKKSYFNFSTSTEGRLSMNSFPVSYFKNCLRVIEPYYDWILMLVIVELTVGYILNEFMMPSFLPKCQQKILRISALEVY